MATATVKTITTGQLERKVRDDVGVHVWNVLTDEWFTGELIPGGTRRRGRRRHTLKPRSLESRRLHVE